MDSRLFQPLFFNCHDGSFDTVEPRARFFSFFRDSKWRLEEKTMRLWATGRVMRSNSTPSKLCLYYYKYSRVIQSCHYLDTCQCKSLLLLPREPCCDEVPQSICCHSHKLFSQSWTDVSPLTCRRLTFDYPETLWLVAMESFPLSPFMTKNVQAKPLLVCERTNKHCYWDLTIDWRCEHISNTYSIHPEQWGESVC